MTEGKNSKPESKEEPPKLDQEQYDMLICCSKNKDFTEWNEWREDNPDEEIFLGGADLQNAHLEGFNLSYVHLYHANLRGANLKGANLSYAHLEFANLSLANLKNANLSYTHLEDAGVIQTNLEGADLRSAKLQGAFFFGAIVNGATFLLFCEVDRDTEFRETGLENACIESGTKQLLKYNERRINWGHWYKEHRFLKWPVKLFWSISNYGINTLRIIVWFFGLALFFAGLYYILSVVSPPGVVNSLVEGKEGLVPGWLIPFRSIYFSIVTMTTLGFGDMHANCRSFLGHLLLTIQVILGYVLLGALVTRLAVLFTADGPAGSFTPMDKETKELLAKLEEDKRN